jgi:hypothetical protein
MNAGSRSAFADPELIEILGDELDLLVIADAIAATQPLPARRSRSIPARLAAAALALGAVIALILVAPWEQTGGNLVDRALAAIGAGPVLHTVIAQPNGESLIELASGKEQRQLLITESWYDQAAAKEHTITRLAGRVIDDTLQSPTGARSNAGLVYTCAWIAAHPVEATKAGVSCSFSGRNGTVPKKIPEAPPEVDPGLSGYLTSYRDALARGQAHQLEEGELEGKPVAWLEFRLPDITPPPGAPGHALQQSERVALDRGSYKPLLVRSFVDGEFTREYRVLEIETVTEAAADFAEPKRTPPEPSSGTVTSSREISLAEAAQLLGNVVWAGRELDGLKLSALRIEQLRTGYPRGSKRVPTSGRGLALIYGQHMPSTLPPISGGGLWIRESSEPQMAYGAAAPAAFPPEGTLAVQSSSVLTVPNGPGTEAVPSGASIWSGRLRVSGMYVVLRAPSRKVLLDAARALTPISASSS